MEANSPELSSSDKVFNFDGAQSSFFPSVGLKLTGACRMRCPFCCEPNRAQALAPIDIFVAIADKLRQWGTRRLCLTGGEPLLYPKIDSFLKHTKSLGFYNLLLTSDGALFKDNHNQILPFVDAVRFSVHAVGSQHDELVGYIGSFLNTEKAVALLAKRRIPYFVTTVVTPLNINSLSDIAEWCFSKRVEKYFLFGLMRSGLGQSFINKYGEVPPADISPIVSGLKRRFSHNEMEIIYYDYNNNAECILIYGDGRVVIDPYADSQSFQLEIGNIFCDSSSEILDRFFKDPRNFDGYNNHLNMYNKLST